LPENTTHTGMEAIKPIVKASVEQKQSKRKFQEPEILHGRP
jgi:hypothetical protein